jgi:hypothetical protein
MDRQGRDPGITLTTTAHISETQMKTRFACAVIMRLKRRPAPTFHRSLVAISHKLGLGPVAHNAVPGVDRRAATEGQSDHLRNRDDSRP